MDPPPIVHFEVGPAEVVVTAEERRRAGLDHWVDGTMGFHRRNGRTLVVAPNGPVLSRHDLSAGGFLDGLLAPSEPIRGLPDDVDHASGGPLYETPDGELLLLYHGERFRNGDHRDFWSFLGLARSSDGGRTFEDLGPVVTSDVVEEDPDRPTPVELGAGGLLVRDGWFDVYFQDRSATVIRRHLALARAPLDDVLDAVRSGRTPVLRKYHAGRFDEPAIGGRSDELLPGPRYGVAWSDVAYLEGLGCVAMVYSAAVAFVGRQVRWNHFVVLSRDGLRFGKVHALHEDAPPGEMLYVTVDSGGPLQRHVTGDRFWIYAVRSWSAYRWDDAWLERYEVVFREHEVAAGGGGES